MALSLKQSQAITELAAHLYDYLPGNPHPYADPDLSFPGAARAAGVGRYWPGGSKQPAINKLLALTLEHDKGRFCSLIVATVRRAIAYRGKKNEPIQREEIDRLNRLVEKVGFKIPELWEREFLDNLPSGTSGSESAGEREEERTKALEMARKRFDSLQSLPPQQRGYEFEKFLVDLFEASGLQPRSGFRNKGEQIDGSFSLEGEVYLLEARWRNQPADQSDLLTFSGKVRGKSEWGRGLFVSYSGFTSPGLEAFYSGQATNIVCADGLDLHHTLSVPLDWATVIVRKARSAAETGRCFTPVRELYPSTT